MSIRVARKAARFGAQTQCLVEQSIQNLEIGSSCVCVCVSSHLVVEVYQFRALAKGYLVKIVQSITIYTK